MKSYAFFNITSSFDLDKTTYITFLKEGNNKKSFRTTRKNYPFKDCCAERKGGNRGNSPSPPANKGQIEGGEEGEGARGWKPSQVGRASFRTQRRRPDHEGLHGPTNSLLPVKRDREIFLKYENLTHFFSLLSRETGSKRGGHRFGFPTTAAQKWTHEQEKEKERALLLLHFPTHFSPLSLIPIPDKTAPLCCSSPPSSSAIRLSPYFFRLY